MVMAGLVSRGWWRCGGETACVYVWVRANEAKGDMAVLLIRGHKVIYGRLDRCRGYGDKAIPG